MRLQERAGRGIALPADATKAEKLKHVQAALEAGHEGAGKIFDDLAASQPVPLRLSKTFVDAAEEPLAA